MRDPHHQLNTPTNSQIRNSVEKVAAPGLRLRISELDICAEGSSEEFFARQAEKYAFVMRLARKYKDQFEAAQVWGLTDQMSWRSTKFPLLFTGTGKPKPAFRAVADPKAYP